MLLNLPRSAHFRNSKEILDRKEVRMSEADFEREANKLLRDLGLPSDTLNFFESDSAKTSNWKSTLKAPSPPKARRVSSTGTTTQFQRRQRERAAAATANGAPSSVVKRPDRSSIPFRNPPLSQGETPSGTNANRASASAKNRFSTPSGPSSIPVSSSSNIRTKSQSPPPQGLPDQPPASGAPQASSTPTKRQVHRPAPRAPPSGYQSAKSRRASTPSRTTRSVSPTGGPAQKSSAATSTTSQSLSQGSGIPVFNRRLSPSAAAPSSQPAAPSTISSSTNSGGTANSNKPSHSVQKPATKTTVSSTSAKRPAPQVVSAATINTAINTKSSTPSVNGSAAVNGEVHAYESIDGNLVSRSRKKSASPPVKQSMLKKPSSNLNPLKYSEVNHRLSVPEKSHDGRTPESQKAVDDRGGSKADHKQLLQLLSVSTKSQNSKQTPKPTTDTKAAAASTSTSSTSTASKPVRPERTSVLSYSRIPISSSTSSSSKSLPPTSQSSSEAKSAAAASSTTTTNTTTGAGGSSKIPQPQSGGGSGFARGGGTWATSSTKTRQQHQQQQQQQQLKQEQQPKVQEKPQEKPLGEVGGGNSRSVMTYDSLSPSDLDAILKQDDSFLLKENDRPPQKADANVSGVYDRLTPKEIMMILQDEDVSKGKDRGEKSAELKQNGVNTIAATSSTDPMEHLYARVNKRRRHSDGQGAPENRQSLTSPISDPGTADQTTKKGKRHSADETVRSDSRGSSNPPSRSSSRELRSSEKLLNGSVQQQNGRLVSSSGSTATGTTTTVSSPESLTDRQTPDSEERRSRISVSWPKQSLDITNTNAMSAMATTTVQALQTLVEVMTPQPSPLKSDGKKFNYEDESSGTTPWYLLDTEENESTGSSHPLSPDLSSELLSTTTTTSPLSLQQAGTIVNGEAKTVGKTAGRRYSDTASKPQVEPKAHTQQSSSSSKGSASGASNRVLERRRSSGQMNDSSRKSSSTSNPPSADSPSSRKTSTSDRASQSSHGNHGNHLTVKDQPNWPGQKRKISPEPPPPISRTLSSPEHDYAILDPEFNEEFFGYCARCSKPVIGVETGCLALDRVYHLGCFTCSKCHASLSGQNFYMLEDTIVCEADFLRTLERCHACKQRIQDRVLRACGQCYHPSCFRCVVCGQCLDGVPYIVSNSLKVYCIHDYHKKHAPKCAVCGESIIPRSGRTKSLRVTASGRSYHVDCYKCEDCGRQLASKGGDEKCYPLEGHLYCRECNAARVYQWYKLSGDYQQEPGLIV